jgi:hypothetical protein
MIDQPVQLTIVGAAKTCGPREEGSFFEGDFLKINNFFKKIKPEYPKIFKHFYWNHGYSEKIDSEMGNFITSRIIGRELPFGKIYRVDQNCMFLLYERLNEQEKKIANDIGKKFYDELWIH